MNRMEVIQDITMQLKKLLDQDITAKNRQAVIEELNSLLDTRGQYMDKITPPFTEEEKRIGEQLVDVNKTIEANMQTVFDELKHEMKQSKKQKKSNRNYVNPYDKVQTVDGMFMDHKK